MKLLLDQNLSYRIVRKLDERFPGSDQVRQLGMETASDLEIWNYAGSHGYTVVTKDSDFHELSLLSGPPPHVIWLKCGNLGWTGVAELLLAHADDIESFLTAGDVACLEIYR